MNETLSVWVAGARPRTLPAAVAPILAGCRQRRLPLGHHDWLAARSACWSRWPSRWASTTPTTTPTGCAAPTTTASAPRGWWPPGLAPARAVKAAAFGAFAFAGVVGLVVVALSGQWWLIGVGALSILAAWYYTGGDTPYGYLGLGEVMVFVFFGLVATIGTCYVIGGSAPLHAWLAATAVGSLASAILVANNLRDIDTDRALGQADAAGPAGGPAQPPLLRGPGRGWPWPRRIAFAALTTWWALLGLVGVPLLVTPLRLVLGGASGKALIPVIQATGMAEIGIAAGLLAGTLLG